MPGSNSSRKTTWLQMRSCKRVSSRIPVVIQWTEGDQQRSADGFTTDIGRLGCLVITAQDLAVQQRVRLTNQDTQKLADAAIAWKEQNADSNWEIGLELLTPPSGFWGQKL